ncbi:hypothetical protein KC866_03850 [Patescibacteria group bacterium]|nr:hypothetical protein [Patescibacteria group bacterium]
MDKETINKLGDKLDVLTALLLKLIPKNPEGPSLREQIELLDGLNVRPKDIAKIIGRADTYVNKELVGIRKNKKK